MSGRAAKRKNAKSPRREPFQKRYNKLLYDETNVPDEVERFVTADPKGLFDWKNRGNSEMIHLPDGQVNFHSLHTRNPGSVRAWNAMRRRGPTGWARIAYKLQDVKFDKDGVGIVFEEEVLFMQLMSAINSDRTCTPDKSHAQGSVLQVGMNLTEHQKNQNKQSFRRLLEKAVGCSVLSDGESDSDISLSSAKLKRRFVMMTLHLHIIDNDPVSGHANIILLDLKKRRFRIFEPHGANSTMFVKTERVIRDILYDFRNSENEHWHFDETAAACPRTGQQDGTGSSCAAWSSFFSVLMMRQPSRDPVKVVSGAMAAIHKQLIKMQVKDGMKTNDWLTKPVAHYTNDLKIKLNAIFIRGFTACIHLMIPRIQYKSANGGDTLNRKLAKRDRLQASIATFVRFMHLLHKNDPIWQKQNKPKVYVDRFEELRLKRVKRAEGRARAAAFRAKKAANKARIDAKKARAAANKAKQKAKKAIKDAREARAKAKKEAAKAKKRYRKAMASEDTPLSDLKKKAKKKSKTEEESKAAENALDDAEKALEDAEAAFVLAENNLSNFIGSPEERKARRAVAKAARLARVQAAAEARRAVAIARAQKLLADHNKPPAKKRPTRKAATAKKKAPLAKSSGKRNAQTQKKKSGKDPK